MSEANDNAEPLREAVLAAADEISDPCSVAAAQPLGIAEMGLVRELILTPTSGGHAVQIVLRLTAPGCLYWVYFERELRARIAALTGVTEVVVRRDPSYDWSEDDIAPVARRRLAEGRARRVAEVTASRGLPYISSI
jgi:metal-sulfur cluster biosynthetic enzyme